MKLHSLGETQLQVSPLGLGLAALGRPGYINLGHAGDLHGDYAVEDMQANAHAVLDAAYQAGVRYFDAARSYGKAEVFLGSWLRSREIPPESVTVASKWGYTYTAAWQVKFEGGLDAPVGRDPGQPGRLPGSVPDSLSDPEERGAGKPGGAG